jgi:histidine transport system ATP-binding protein
MEKLVVKDLHKSYGSHEVLKGISLKAKAGDVISIIGSSGSGKSTFLRCINFLEKPNAGSISLGGEEIACKKQAGRTDTGRPETAASHASKLAMVFQHFNLWAT